MTDVIVDTTVWSLFLRRPEARLSPVERSLREELRERITTREALLIGAVYQEVLSGIRTNAQFVLTRHTLATFGLVRVTRLDFETAAGYYNTCQRSGIQGSHTDFLVCAVSSRLGLPVFTADRDFSRYAQHLPIRLHEPA